MGIMNTVQLMQKITDLSRLEDSGMVERALKTSEETGELAQAVLSYKGMHGTAYKGKTSEDVLEEVADVIMCAMSVAIAAGYSTMDIESMIAVKCEKWESKL